MVKKYWCDICDTQLTVDFCEQCQKRLPEVNQEELRKYRRLAQTRMSRHESKELMKKMFSAAVAKICRMRNLFTEDLFTEYSDEEIGTNIQVLKKTDDHSVLLMDWVYGVHFAIDCEILGKLLFRVYDPRHDINDISFRPKYDQRYNIVEEYAFSMSYWGNVEGVIPEVVPIADTWTSACTFIQQLGDVIGALDILPEQRILMMDLYRGGNRRNAYFTAPRGFKDSTPDSENLTSSIPIHHVKTTHYTLFLEVRTVPAGNALNLQYEQDDDNSMVYTSTPHIHQD